MAKSNKRNAIRNRRNRVPRPREHVMPVALDCTFPVISLATANGGSTSLMVAVSGNLNWNDLTTAFHMVKFVSANLYFVPINSTISAQGEFAFGYDPNSGTVTSASIDDIATRQVHRVVNPYGSQAIVRTKRFPVTQSWGQNQFIQFNLAASGSIGTVIWYYSGGVGPSSFFLRGVVNALFKYVA